MVAVMVGGGECAGFRGSLGDLGGPGVFLVARGGGNCGWNQRLMPSNLVISAQGV